MVAFEVTCLHTRSRPKALQLRALHHSAAGSIKSYLNPSQLCVRGSLFASSPPSITKVRSTTFVFSLYSVRLPQSSNSTKKKHSLSAALCSAAASSLKQGFKFRLCRVACLLLLNTQKKMEERVTATQWITLEFGGLILPCDEVPL